jgi:amino acid adenylation domain-containing protein
LSFAQQRLWFLHQLEPESIAYNIPIAFQITGKLDLEVLDRSLAEIVRRHEVLRTSFPVLNGHPVQQIAEASSTLLTLVDLSELEQSETKARELASAEATRPFDLLRGPLFRATLVRLRDEKHLLLLTLHHSVTDFWSINILIREFTVLYDAILQGRPSPLSDLTLQYADFALWQRQWLTGEILDAQISFWREQLSGAPLTELPADFALRIPRSGQGKRLRLQVPPGLLQRLTELSRGQSVTLFMTLLASFQFLLGRYCGQDDVVVGTSIANRRFLETERLIGFFVNLLALRGQLRPECTFNDFLVQIRHMVLDAYAHQDMPYDYLVQVLARESAQQHRQLFQAVLALQNYSEEPSYLADLEFSPWERDHCSTQFDLMLSLALSESGLTGTLVYAADRFKPDRMEWFASAFLRVLEQVATEPKARLFEISLLSEMERQQLLTQGAQAQGSLSKLCIHELFEIQARRQPEAVAVRCEEIELTYSVLNRRTNQLAHYLISMGVGPEVRVGICLERSPELVVAVLAVLKAGGAYMPVDLRHPAERMKYMLEDSGVSVMLTSQQLSGRFASICQFVISLDVEWNLIASSPDQDCTTDLSLDTLAYIVYTSGSTGMPKGVMVTHRGLSNYADWAATAYECSQGTGSPVHSTLSFDLTVTSIFPALIVGRKVTLLDEKSPVEDLANKLVSGEPFSLVKLTPSHLKLLAQYMRGQCHAVHARSLVIGGEALHYEDINFWKENSPATKLINEYGPSETVVGSCMYSMEGAFEEQGLVPIGKPIQNTRVYVLDHWNTLCPPGVRGELLIGGAGLARGYLNQPAMTSTRFIPDFFGEETGARLYRTGDLVGWRSDGNLEFFGRLDNQVKIRGYRIEPQEVEMALKSQPLLRNAAVIASTDSEGRARLVAYVVPHEETNVSDRELRAYLQTRLPDYMIPAVITIMSDLPLTANGKVDQKLLPAPQWNSKVSAMNTPRTKVEQQLVNIWREVLSLDQVGLEDDFFERGGHSLLAVKLITEIQGVFGVELPLQTVFDRPTIISQAALLENTQPPESSSPLVRLQINGSRPPLFCVHPFFGLAHCYKGLSELLGADQPLYGLQSHGLEQWETPLPTIPEMASHYLRAIRYIQPAGPYQLAGWSMGSVIAFEMAQQLVCAGETVSFLGFFEGRRPWGAASAHSGNAPANWEALVAEREAEALIQLAAGDLQLSEGEIRLLSPEQRIARYLDSIKARDSIAAAFSHEQLRRLLQVSVANLLALEFYEVKTYPGDVILFRIPLAQDQDESYGWSKIVLGHTRVYEVPGKHSEFLSGTSVRLLADKIKLHLRS